MRRALVCAAVVALAGGLVVAVEGPASAAPGEGAADATFGTGGKVATPIAIDDDRASDVAVQSDGKIVLVGWCMTGGDWAIGVARYNENGTPDTTFDGDGKVVSLIPGYASAHAESVVLQRDGKIVVAGHAGNAPASDFALARYNTDGSLDHSFGSAGIVTTEVGSADTAHAYAMALQPDQKIVVAGDADNPGQGFALARYDTDGMLDETFGVGGIATPAVGGSASAQAVAVQPDGKIVAAGSTNLSPGRFALVRLAADGTPDPDFGAGGIVTTPVGGYGYGVAYGLALQPDGKIVAAGKIATAGTGDRIAVVRYTSAGEPDVSFDTDGTVITAIDYSATAQAVALQRDGKIVIAGSAKQEMMGAVFAFARYNRDGSPDTGLNGSGTVNTGFGSGGATAIVLQRDGKILLAGSSYGKNPDDGDSYQFRYALARYVGDTVAPVNGRLVGTPRYARTLTPRLVWRATDDNTGVRSFDVQYRVARYDAASYGGYHTWKSATTRSSGRFAGQPGRTYCLSVQARDWAGNVGTYGTQSCVAFPVDDRRLAATGAWTKLAGKAYYASTARRTSAQGASLRLAVHYRHLALVATKGPGAGKVNVYVRGTLVKTIRLAAAHTQHRVLIPITSATTVRSATVKIVHSGDRPVVIDGLGVSLN